MSDYEQATQIRANMLTEKPHFYDEIRVINTDGLFFLEVIFNKNNEEKAGYGFIGGYFSETLNTINQSHNLTNYFDSYGIQIISSHHFIVPIPRTLIRLHNENIKHNRPHSFYEPEEVNGHIDSATYLDLLARGKWPIDSTGSIEFMHDLLNHWTVASVAPKHMVQISIDMAKTAKALSKNQFVNLSTSRKRVTESIASKVVGSIDQMNSTFIFSINYKSVGIKHIARVVKSALRSLVSLSRNSISTASSQGSISLSAFFSVRALSLYLIHQTLSLKPYFKKTGSIDYKALHNQINSDYEHRLNQLSQQ